MFWWTTTKIAKKVNLNKKQHSFLRAPPSLIRSDMPQSLEICSWKGEIGDNIGQNIVERKFSVEHNRRFKYMIPYIYHIDSNKIVQFNFKSHFI